MIAVFSSCNCTCNYNCDSDLEQHQLELKLKTRPLVFLFDCGPCRMPVYPARGGCFFLVVCFARFFLCVAVLTVALVFRFCPARRKQKRAVAGGTGAKGRAHHAARQEYDGEFGVEYQQGASNQVDGSIK